MLILQRRKGESIQIGNDITITVTELGADRVRLAIDAPRKTVIKRTELLEAVRMNREAATGAPAGVLQTLLKYPKE